MKRETSRRERVASFVKREETNMKCVPELKNKQDTLYASRLNLHASRFTRYASRVSPFASRDTLHASRFTRYAARCAAGFTMIEVIGVLAVMATLMAIVAPTVLDQIDRAVEEAEVQNLSAIAEGVELYLRSTYTWPSSLSDLSPDYISMGTVQLTTNARGYPRYLVVHPDTSGYVNATGLAQSALADARYLLISNVSADAAPSISTAGEFDTFWNTNETSTPDLKIHRGHVASLFHLVSISAVGTDGSYRIDGTSTNAGNGGTLAMRATYHIRGTVIEFDEDFNFSPGNFAFGISLANDVGYQYDPTCTAGTMWHVLGSSCS